MKCLGMNRRLITGKAKPTDHPCGMCINCKATLSAEYATKIIYESWKSQNAYFGTNTFDPTYADSMDPKEWPKLYTKFAKALRERERRRGNKNLRISYSFEYGGKFGHPHFHPCLFNYSGGYEMNRHNQLLIEKQIHKDFEELWNYGFHQLEPIKSASAVGRYVSKHITNFSEDKGDINGYGLKPYRVSPKHLGWYNYSENLKNWNRADIDRNYVPDPMDPGRLIPMPREWKNKIFSDETRIKQKIKTEIKAIEEWRKLSYEDQKNEGINFINKSENAHNKVIAMRKFFSPEKY